MRRWWLVLVILLIAGVLALGAWRLYRGQASPVVRLASGEEVSANSLLIEFREGVPANERERIVRQQGTRISTGRGAEAARLFGAYAIEFRRLPPEELVVLRARLLSEPGVRNVEYNAVIHGF